MEFFVNQRMPGYGFCHFLHTSANDDSSNFEGKGFISETLVRAMRLALPVKKTKAKYNTEATVSPLHLICAFPFLI